MNYKEKLQTFKLNDNQKELVKELEQLIDKLSQNNVELVYDNDLCEFVAINIDHIKDSCWELEYNIKDENATIVDPFHLKDFGQQTTLDQYIVVPAWDGMLVVKEWKED
jgi:hypothetical protein